MNYVIVFLCITGIYGIQCCLDTSEIDIKIEIGESRVFEASLFEALRNGSNSSVYLTPEHEDIIAVTTVSNTAESFLINISGLAAGKSDVFITCSSNLPDEPESFFVLVQVHRSKILEIISLIFGWLYFISWSACFYPQLYDNYKTKSVVGLNFDTVLFGLVGYIMYNTFNVAMVYIPLIKRQYFQRYPQGITPVLTNDLVFSMHGVAVTSATTYQCFTYYREKQKVSTMGATIIGLCFLIVACGVILALWDVILWLDVVYLCSYIKMYGNVMLYIPQVYMNYKRRSTAGFSILGVIIDLCGGVFSMIQVFMDGYNYDDWKTILENPTKFGIGIITLGVSIVFIIQHYVLYSEKPRKQNLELKRNP